MSRLHYLAALLYLGLSLAVLGAPDVHPAVAAGPVFGGGTAAGWFQSVKPYCNSLEVDLTLQRTSPPAGLEGTGYAAACLALAGRIDAARERLLTLPESDRYKGAGIVFEVGHPVADAGDDRSAGPIMGLVVEFWPNHYMALYHAGMAHWSLGQRAEAREFLERFLENYDVEDGWRRNALSVLARMRGE